MDDRIPKMYKTENKDYKGVIKDIKYYGEGDNIESVGIMEYTDKTSTHLTLTYGAKN
ncbi:MAG: hypothetical protein IJ638_01405 [Alphaproteobacteria bacterium]|nr:hypothetical protein [Alphaproteobacteria bacterium]